MPVHRNRIIAIFFATGISFSLLFTALSISTFAQGDVTPTPFVNIWYTDPEREWTDGRFAEPGTTVGDATWVVGESVLVSNYPDGINFSVNVESDMGDIAIASVIWSHTPNQLTRRETQDIGADGQVEIDVRFGFGGTPPPFTAINYYWSFADSEGNRYRTEWIIGNEFLPDNLDEWTRVESEDVIIAIQDGLPDSIIDMTLDAMRQQRNTFKQAWGRLISYKPRVILFEDQDDFNLIFGSFTGAIIGRTSDEWGATVQIVANDDYEDLTYGTVVHEIAHLYQFDIVGGDAFPGGSWFTEGNATLFELDQLYDYSARVRGFAVNGQLPSLLLSTPDVLFSFQAGPDGSGRLGYDVGYTFFDWVVRTYGLEGHRAIVQELINGADRNTAISNALGLSLVEIETRWARWLGADAPGATAIPINDLQIPPTSTPFRFD